MYIKFTRSSAFVKGSHDAACLWVTNWSSIGQYLHGQSTIKYERPTSTHSKDKKGIQKFKT